MTCHGLAEEDETRIGPVDKAGREALREEGHGVLANREFEAWFLAATRSLVASGKLPVGVDEPREPESVADPKGWLSTAIGGRYSETIDQPSFAAMFDLAEARCCGSFDKLVREFDAMVQPG